MIDWRLAALTLMISTTVVTHAVASQPFHAPERTGEQTQGQQDKLDRGVFVKFDQQYIPALALTNQEKPAAEEALRRFSQSWDTRFVGQLHRMFDDDPLWPHDMSRVAQCIALGQAAFNDGDSQAAHEALEPIRDILMNARRRNHFDYPLDLLSQFHATMEEIVKPAMGMTPEKLTSDQVDRFQASVQQAVDQWDLVNKADFLLDEYGKSEREQERFRELLRDESRALEQLKSQLNEKDHAAILEAARRIKPPFAKVYMFFGHFAFEAENDGAGR